MKRIRATTNEVSNVECFARIFDALGFATIVIAGDRQVLHSSRLAEQHMGAG